MKKTQITNASLIFMFLITIAFGSCKELFEPILSGKQIVITAPVDNLVTTAASNTFVWEPVEGATKYQLQIVSPKFDSVVNFVADSSFTNSLLTYTLTPGTYQWRVRAVNASSQTNYFTRTITIQ